MALLAADEFYQASRDAILIDVRSPAEFSAGHMAGAINVPLFDDQQRAIVGTTYAEKGHRSAVLAGLEIVGPKMADLVRTVDRLPNVSSSQRVFVHCWRGGMRSQSFAWLLETAGRNVSVLDGGYKAFRKLVQRKIGFRHRLVVLSGLTGAGKTVFLKRLQAQSEQIIDLESLANHRGSSFGAIGLGSQPTTEQFENRLFSELETLDPQRRIWVEDEGSRLGHVVVPPRFVKQVRRAPAIFLDVPKQRRIENLVAEYGSLDRSELIEATRGIQKRLGGQNTTDAIAAIENGDLRKATDISLSYYDRSYLKAKSGLPRQQTINLSTEHRSDGEITAMIKSAADALTQEMEGTQTSRYTESV